MALLYYNVEYRTQGGAITFRKRLRLNDADPQAAAEMWLAAVSETATVTKVEAA